MRVDRVDSLSGGKGQAKSQSGLKNHGRAPDWHRPGKDGAKNASRMSASHVTLGLDDSLRMTFDRHSYDLRGRHEMHHCVSPLCGRLSLRPALEVSWPCCRSYCPRPRRRAAESQPLPSPSRRSPSLDRPGRRREGSVQQAPLGTNRQPGSWEYRFHVVQAEDRWLWVTDGQISGWLHENEVVPSYQAIDYFTAVILSHPYSGAAMILRGHLWADSGRTRRSPSATSPTRSSAIHERVGIPLPRDMHGNKRDYYRAIDDYNEAIRLNCRCATAYDNRGLGLGPPGRF